MYHFTWLNVLIHIGMLLLVLCAFGAIVLEFEETVQKKMRLSTQLLVAMALPAMWLALEGVHSVLVTHFPVTGNGDDLLTDPAEFMRKALYEGGGPLNFVVTIAAQFFTAYMVAVLWNRVVVKSSRGFDGAPPVTGIGPAIESIELFGTKVIGLVKATVWLLVSLVAILFGIAWVQSYGLSSGVLPFAFAFVTFVWACRNIAPAFAKQRPPLDGKPHGDASAATEGEAVSAARGLSKRTAVHSQTFAD